MPSHSHSHAHPAQPTVAQLEAAIKAKFTRLAALQAQLQAMKALYAEHDALTEELMGMFIIKNGDESFTVKRSVTVGHKTFRLNPSFYDGDKNKLTAKRWRSGATPTVVIEA
jgi:hypothetical protein